MSIPLGQKLKNIVWWVWLQFWNLSTCTNNDSQWKLLLEQFIVIIVFAKLWVGNWKIQCGECGCDLKTLVPTQIHNNIQWELLELIIIIVVFAIFVHQKLENTVWCQNSSSYTINDIQQKLLLERIIIIVVFVLGRKLWGINALSRIIWQRWQHSMIPVGCFTPPSIHPTTDLPHTVHWCWNVIQEKMVYVQN